MLMQIGLLGSLAGPVLSSVGTQAAASGASQGFFSGLSSAITSLGGQVLTSGIDLGKQYVGGLINRELSRDAINAQIDAQKSLLRAAANVVSPTVAPGQTAVFSGGPATGQAYRPATVLPPSISPPNQILQINPEFAQGPATMRRLAPRTGIAGVPVGTGFGIQPVSAQGFGVPVISDLLHRTGEVTPRTGIPRLDLGQNLPAFQAQAVQPSGAQAMPALNGGGTLHRYTRNRDNTGSQVFVPADKPGMPGMIPIEQALALGVTDTSCRYRFDQIKGEYVRMKQRRMNPTNTRAFFRAGRRIDAMERIARKLFSEKKKSKTAAVKRKGNSKKK